MRVAIRTEECMRVPIDHVKHNVGLGRSINQIIRNLIKPELQRRGRPRFSAAIVEMFTEESRKTILHFDEEAPLEIHFKDHRASPECVEKSFRQLGWTMDAVKDLRIPDDFGDPNSAKVFIVRSGDTFFFSFDFRYNAQKVRAKLERAREFISAVRALDLQEHHYAACYLLWSAVELIADAVLLSLPDAKPTKDHAERLRKLRNTKKNLNVISDEIVTLLGDFEKVKPIARYPDRSSNVKSRKLRGKMDADYFEDALEKIEQELENNVILKV